MTEGEKLVKDLWEDILRADTAKAKRLLEVTISKACERTLDETTNYIHLTANEMKKLRWWKQKVKE